MTNKIQDATVMKIRRDNEYDLMIEIETKVTDVDAELSDTDMELLDAQVKSELHQLSAHYNTGEYMRIESAHLDEYYVNGRTVTYRYYIDLVNDLLPHISKFI